MAHGHKATKCRNRAATNISGSLRTNPISEAEYPTLISVAAILITNIQTEYLSNPTLLTLIGPFDEAGIMMSKKSQTEIGWYICLERSGFGDQTSKNCIDTLFCTVQLLPLFLLSAAPLGNVVNLAIASTVLMRAT